MRGESMTYVAGGDAPVPLVPHKFGAPPAPKPTGLDWAALTQAATGPSDTAAAPEKPPAPDYVTQITTLMVATEGHHAATVRAARKAAANAFVALNKAFTAYLTSGPDTVEPRRGTASGPSVDATPVTSGPEAPPQSKGQGAKHSRWRLDALGVKAKDVRVWAAENNVPCPAKGIVPAHVVDAYEKARP